MFVNRLRSPLNPRRGIPAALGLLLLGILASAEVALAQRGDVNEAIRRDRNVQLFDGTSIDMNDLLRAVEFLSRQNAASRWDSRAEIDAAVEQFNQSRRRSLPLSPGSLTPEPAP
ncbi:hypothetical protein NW851_02265 [Synechococcus sp. H55.7]|uniref:hypothetical protein n=1 Tax=unclassified Synechococcus TaxID=2626047 RepID=UPI0039C4E338